MQCCDLRNRYSMRPSVLWNIQARARGRSPEGELPCILHKTRGFLMLYVFYITTTPYLPCNNNNINRKELYDFYYTAITLTTGYKIKLYTNKIIYTHNTVIVHNVQFSLYQSSSSSSASTSNKRIFLPFVVNCTKKNRVSFIASLWKSK